ncbi:MAG: 3-dehydroquinate synthase [Microscillaceae bacterium]|jgi:3-dehydroquinate synthase|nr:3-dehydroquinate synthase [Microscillaceae bacterium]
MFTPINQDFSVAFSYQTHFTRGLFALNNPLFYQVLTQYSHHSARKLFFVIDKGVATHHPDLVAQIQLYVQQYPQDLLLTAEPMCIEGGEQVKNNPQWVDDILQAVEKYGICRHSYLIAIGGGAVLDMVGYAAAIAHRGVRHIRIPTTVLAQNDSGVGVKNGINYRGKKNFLGSFKPPLAVINDFDFLPTLSERDWRSGIAEAIKVALIKDEAFFRQIQQDCHLLNQRDAEAMHTLIYRCAEMHLAHIASGDPFELGSSRPLDFGHWAAHKLEYLTDFALRHGEAVAIGMALDVSYSYLQGMISQDEWEQILTLMQNLGFALYHPALRYKKAEKYALLLGLEEFREHLGGELTIMLLQKIGKGQEVHALDAATILQSVELLEARNEYVVVV